MIYSNDIQMIFNKIKRTFKEPLEPLYFTINDCEITVYEGFVEIKDFLNNSLESKKELLRLLEIKLNKEYEKKIMDNRIFIINEYSKKLNIRGTSDIENLDSWSLDEIKAFNEKLKKLLCDIFLV